MIPLRRTRVFASWSVIVVKKFAEYLEREPHDDALLEAAERAIEDMLSAFSQIQVDAATDSIFRQDAEEDAEEDYEALVWTMVSGQALFQVLAKVASQKAGFPWGEHLFSAAELRLVQREPLPERLPSAAIKRLIPDLASDLAYAMDKLTDSDPVRANGIMADIDKGLKRICRACDCADDHRNGLTNDWGLGELMTPKRAGEELRIDAPDVVRRIDDRGLVGVPLWTGAWRVPGFQFVRGELRDDVKFVLTHAHDDLRGWQLALWLAKAIQDSRSQDWYETVLSDRGHWKPHWSSNETGEFGTYSLTARATSFSGELYRISRRGLRPFYFSHVEESEEGHLTPPAGRFDLDSDTSSKGTMYTATTAMGACTEVLDRELVLTLSEVLNRSMWRLEPRNPIKVVDLTSLPSSLPATRNRRETQYLAFRVSLEHEGLLVGLRTSQAEIGLAVFGDAGAHLPSAVDLGLWSADSEPLVHTDALWEYVDARDQDQAGFPVLLRQFPDVSIIPPPAV